MKKLLFEIGTEELPANYMPNILKDLKQKFNNEKYQKIENLYND